MDRNRRHSLHTNSSNYVITTLRDKIKGIESQKGERLDLLDPTRNGAVVHHEQILVNKRTRNVRKVYMNDHRYKIGWVVDWDLNHCMVCSAQFGWILGRPKHHCRACGALVCHGCSPYVTQVPSLNEFGGSRVCINCFGLKPGMFSPTIENTKANQEIDAYSICSNSPLPSPGNSFSKRHSASFMSSITDDTTPIGSVRRPKSSRNRHSSGMGIASTPVQAMGDLTLAEEALAKQIEEFEREQLPLYQEDYLKMREFVPLDIYKTSVDRMIEQGLTPAVAARIWTNKALWLICMHKDDIAKIHLADFRGKYSPEGLDVREMRAIWYNLPVWDEHSTNPLEVGKAEWRSGFKSKLDNQVYKMHAGTLAEQFKRHPDYEECELNHVFDPTIPLRTRYERSASLHQHAISSPHDVNLFDNHLRAQVKPHKVAKGTVRDKTRAYLSNYDEDGLPIARDMDEQDDGEYEPMWAEVEEEEYQPMWAEETEEGVYAYEESDSGLLGKDVDHTKPPSGVAVRSKYNSPAKEAKRQGLVQDFNAEHDAEISDLDNDIEDDATDPYLPPHTGSAGSASRSPQRVPFGGVAIEGVSSVNVPETRLSRGLSGHSLRSASDHSAAASSHNQSSDTRSHGSFKYRSPALAGTPTSQTIHANQLHDYRHNRDPATHSPVPSSFPKEINSPNRRTTNEFSPKGSGRYSTGSPMVSPSKSAPSRPLSLSTANMTSSFGGGLSPTASQNGKTSPFPVNVSPIPAYTYNQPKSFVPKRDGNPITVKGAQRHSTGSVFFGEQSLVHHQQENYDSNNPHGYSARRLEREQARRMRSAEVRAQTEGYDYNDGSDAGLGDGDYERVSPTSSISSHNDDTDNTPALQPEVKGHGSGDTDDRALTYSPFGGALVVKDGANVTSSEASTERDSVQRSQQSQSSQVAPSTPPPSQHNAPASPKAVVESVEEDEIEEGEEEDMGDDESYMSEDDDLSFNTAEEIKTPMLNRHGHRTGTKKRPTRTPYTVRRAVAASKGTQGLPAVEPVQEEEPAGVPAESLDLSFMRDNLVKYLELGDAQSASSLLSMAKHATPRIPVDSLIDSTRAAQLMMQLFKNPNRLESPEATLKLLVDTMRANVNLVEGATGKALLHYMVENDRQSLGKLLIVRGADIFLEDSTGACPLALNLSCKQDWVAEEYQRSGRQDQLLVSANVELKLKFATHLIFAGYSQQAGVVIRQGNLQISPEQASHLLSSCRGNFENMKDPIETFELLESLGAAYEDS